jgi:hypothetical protein
MHGKRSRRVLGLTLVALALLATSGCKPHEFDVSGKVRYNQETLNRADGQVIFIGPGGEQVAVSIESDGTYRARVPSGLNRIAVYYPNPKLKKLKGSKLKPGEEPPPVESPFLTPAKYAEAETSELSVTVDRDTVFDIDMVGPRIK